MLSPALRKAAILILALDRDSADALLEQMPEEQAAQIRHAAMELPDVNDEEQEQVLREFLAGKQERAVAAAVSDPGVELSLENKSKPASTTDVDSEMQSIIPQFQYLKKAPPATLSQLLRDEHPQIAAVVIAHLPPAKAASVIESFEDQLQIDVLQRVAALGDADPDAIRQLDRELGESLRKIEPGLQLHALGLQTVSAILAATTQRQEIINRLLLTDSPLTQHVVGDATNPISHERQTTPEPTHFHAASERFRGQVDYSPKRHIEPLGENAQQLNQENETSDRRASSSNTTPAGYKYSTSQPPTATLRFSDISQLSDPDLAVLLRAAPPQVVLLSLLGADESFVDRLMRQIPPADARRFHQRFHQTSPVSLQDIDEAQRRLVGVANELIADGQIRRSRPQFAAAD